MYLKVGTRELQPQTFDNNQFVCKVFVYVPVFNFSNFHLPYFLKSLSFTPKLAAAVAPLERRLC